jgi:uncharacterized protein
MPRDAAPAGAVHASHAELRRLAVTKQRLAGPLPRAAGKEAILSTVRDLAYVQWDPVSIVAPSHALTLWSRLGAYRPSDLEELLWTEKRLFEHWTPIASLVLTEDFPLYHALMTRYPRSLSRSWGAQGARAKRFLDAHTALRRRMLKKLAGRPLRMSEFEDHPRTKRDDGEWAPSSDVSEMLFHLLMTGEVMVVGHEGAQNLWGLAEEFLPPWTPRTALSREEFERAAAQRAIRALGAATPPEILFYFVRGRYEELTATLAALEREGTVHRVVVDDLPPKGVVYVHDQDLPLLASIQAGEFAPRTSLVPPFDNMVIHTARADRVFGFHYVREQFLPKAKRKFGTYVLAILRGDRFIGRVDPRLDKPSGTLVVHSVHAEPDAPRGPEVGREVGEALERLAAFLGASEVSYSARVPPAWKSSLR